MEILIVIFGVLILFGLWLVSVFNGLTKLKNRVQEAWSDIDVQLKRRHDLIPNLVNTVKGYAKHEASVLEEVTSARSQAMQASSPGDIAKAENVLQETLKSLFAVAESYPDLKASENFLELQRELTDTEDKVQASRRFYNSQVRDFNTKTQTFPNNFFAKLMGFSDYQFFDAPEEARENPKVEF